MKCLVNALSPSCQCSFPEVYINSVERQKRTDFQIDYFLLTNNINKLTTCSHFLKHIYLHGY